MGYTRLRLWLTSGGVRGDERAQRERVRRRNRSARRLPACHPPPRNTSERSPRTRPGRLPETMSRSPPLHKTGDTDTRRIDGCGQPAHNTSVQVNGSLNPKGQATTYFFQYGTTTGYGLQTRPGQCRCGYIQ